MTVNAKNTRVTTFSLKTTFHNNIRSTIVWKTTLTSIDKRNILGTTIDISTFIRKFMYILFVLRRLYLSYDNVVILLTDCEMLYPCISNAFHIWVIYNKIQFDICRIKKHWTTIIRAKKIGAFHFEKTFMF